MRSFSVKEIDLDLEIALLDGRKVEIAGPKVSLSKAQELVDALNRASTEFDNRPAEERTVGALRDFYAKQLGELYGEVATAEFWLEYVDTQTMREIREYVGNELVGGKKNEPPAVQ